MRELMLLNVLADQELTATDRVVYAVIDTFSETEPWETVPVRLSDNEVPLWQMDSLCFFSGLKALAVRRSMKRLAARGWLLAEYQPRRHAWRLTRLDREESDRG